MTIKMNLYIRILSLLVLINSCKNNQHVINDDFQNKKYYVTSSTNVEELFKQDTIYLTLNREHNKSFTDSIYLAFHFQGKIIRVNQGKKSRITLDKNENGIEGSTQHYDHASYYAEFDFFQNTKQINIFHISKYGVDNKDEAILSESEIYSDTLTYFLSIPNETNLKLIKSIRE